jgi:hypothetical protein
MFYDRVDVLTESVHVDPGAGWFSHFLGFAAETGAGAGAGAEPQRPAPSGSGDAGWLGSIAALAGWARGGGSRALGIAPGGPTPPAATPRHRSTSPPAASARWAARSAFPPSWSRRAATNLTTIGGLVCETLTGVQDGLARA